MKHFPQFLALLFATPAFSQEIPEYVGSDACTDCHVAAAEAWAGSHHALAWTRPSADSVVADFDGTQFTLDGMRARFRVEDDAYHVEVTEQDGTVTDYPVHSVVGIEPLQQYLLETEPGRLQSFDIVWDTEREEWFHLYPDQDLSPDDALHWTGPYKTWNARCAECHATGYEKNYDPVLRTYASTEVEIGVGCEACHGPGSAHIAWTETKEIPPDGVNLGAYGLTMDFGNTEAAIQQCAGCHSRREAYGDGNPVPGTPYHDSYNLAQLRPGLYHADGQILDEVYVYGSFLQSRMYAQGVGCMNCHEPHSAELVAEGNAVCTQCHSPEGDAAFPQAAGAYDTDEHHHHLPGSEGAQCVSCHMSERVYMGVDWRRDHSFRLPRPDLSGVTGAPDACTDCHEGRDPDWAAETIRRWSPAVASRPPHYGEALAQGRKDPTATAVDLAGLAEDANQPGLVRATALWLLEQESDASAADRVAPLLEDGDPLVRSAALGLQSAASPQDRIQRLVGLLDDPVRSVRIAAAREMLGAPIAHLPGPIAAKLQAARSEWQASLANRLDFPETHLQTAGMALTLRNFPAAEAAFREAVRLDPQRTEAWVMLVRLTEARDGRSAAVVILEEAMAANPDDPDLSALQQTLRQ